MSSLLFSVQSILPLFLMMLVGVLLRRRNVTDEAFVSVLNKLCFYLFIPCMTFASAIKADWSAISSPAMYIYFALLNLLLIALLTWVVPRFVRDPAAAGAVTHAAFRPNDVLLGLPLAVLVLGEQASFPFVLLVMIASLLHNTMSVVVLQHFSSQGQKRGLGDSLLAIFKNPLILSALAGLVGALLPFDLPQLLLKPINSFSAAAAPIAMLCIGSRFRWQQLVRDRRLIGAGVLLRLLLAPAFMVGGALLCGIRGGELFCLYLEQAMPTALVCGIITQSMGCDGVLAEEITLVSTLCSVVTLTLGVAVFRGLGII